VGTAADDAAGLAVRELMRADIASLNQGIRNANDAISLIQTADGALQIIDEKLIRMKELAQQAATGTYNSDQRLIIESEYQAMASEITRIANATDFNGIYLLNGNLSDDVHEGGDTPSGELKIHFGTGNDSAEDYYYIQIGDSTASALGLGNTADPDSGWVHDLHAGKRPRAPWMQSTRPSSPRTRSEPTWARCRTGSRTPSPTSRSRPRTSRPRSRGSRTWTWPRR
jgi:flagellin